MNTLSVERLKREGLKGIIALLFTFSTLHLFNPSTSAQVITATITFTNALNLTNAVAISNAVIKVNSDTRTFTNSIFDPTTQIRIATNIGTNIQQQANQFLVHVSTYPFAGITVSSPNATNVALRGTNTQAMEVLFGPTTYARVVYSTQTVGSAIGVRVPYTVESETTRTNVASGLGNWISSTTYNTNGIGHSLFTKFGLKGITISTNYTLSLSDLYVGVHSTTGAVTLTLPTAASASNLTYWIKDESSNAVTTNITIQLASGDRIDTSTNKVISTSAGGLILISRGYTNWFSISTPGGGSSSGIGSVNASNSVFVSTSGNDATGSRGDMAKPFATLLRAKTNALDGDTIFVWPGIYTNNQSLLKSNVNWHFYAGTYVTNISGSTALFGDYQISHIPSIITGDGEFFHSANYPLVELLSNSVVSISCRKISAGNNSAAVSVFGNSQLYLNGNNEGIIETSTTGPSTTIEVNNVQTKLVLNNVKVINNNSSAAARPILFWDSNTNTFLKDSVIVVMNNAATNTIGHFGSILPEIRVYGSLMVSTNIGPRINFLTGTNRVEVSGHVR